MQIIIVLLMLLYIAALSRSFFPFGSEENEQNNPSTEAQRNHETIEPFLSTDSENDTLSESEIFDQGLIKGLYYRGEWSSLKNLSQLNLLSQHTGLATLTVPKEESADSHIEFWFYDGKYIDKKAVKLTFLYNESDHHSLINSGFENNDIEVKITLFDNFDEIFSKSCQGKIAFSDTMRSGSQNKAGKEHRSPITNILIKSEECDISLNARLAADNPIYEANTMDYSIMMTLLCLGHLYACIQMIRAITDDELIGHRYSLITLAFFTSWDIFLCFFHFYQSLYMDSGHFHYLISPAFWYFILATIFETRLLTLIWKARFYRDFETVGEVRRGFASFYLRLYAFLSSIICLGFVFLPNVWFFYATSIFFVPQIIHNSIRGQKPKFDILYIFFLGFLRALLPMYARGYENSIFHLTPEANFSMNYTIIIMTQVICLYLQSKLGSRFFIPSRFLPAKFNYYVNMKTYVIDKEENCSICMDLLCQEPSCAKTPIIKIKRSSPVPVMQTPCKHVFHGKCLKDWMEIKLECPYCRAVLPSLE